MSVVALCPDEMAEHAEPPLSSVAIPAEEVGGRAVAPLMSKLDGVPVPAGVVGGPRPGGRGQGYHGARVMCR